jgi:hypothetical protein
MPTRKQSFAVTEDDARRRAGLRAFPKPKDSADQMGVGLEPELFPIVSLGSGQPGGDPSTRSSDSLAQGDRLV